MVTLARRFPLVTYFSLTFAISWGGFLAALGVDGLVTTRWQDADHVLGAIMAMLAGPTVAALLVTGLVDGRAGYRVLLARLRRWRVGRRWYALALLPAPLISAGVVLALAIPAPLFTGDRTAVVLSGLGAAVTTLLEEIGWTGFAVPRLRRRYSVVKTGVIVGLVWGGWHLLQQVFIAGTYAGAVPQPAFLVLSVLAAVASLTAVRVLLVWLFDRTDSLLVVTVMHGMLTASSIFWFTPIATGAWFLASVWLSAVAWWALVGVVALADGWLRFGHTRPFRGPDGGVLPYSVAEAGYWRLGGVDQWVLVRGEDIANPVLVVLHGGPGMSEMGFFRHFNAPLEQVFTVVHWDQRGTGKSFARDLPPASMTVNRFLDDLDELVDRVRQRFGKTRVGILGHSWGSALGALYAARHPEKVSVYVGAAQIGDWAAAEAASYAYGLAEAERQHDTRALERLRAIGPPPHPASRVFVERAVVTRLDGQMRPRILWKAARALFGRPESSIADLPNLLRGFRFTLDAMWAEVSSLNLVRQVPALQMPVIFAVGRRDHWVPPETSVAYFEALRAPSKRLVWFDHSGHEAFVDEPARFNAMLVRDVRPLACRRDGHFAA